MLAKLEQSPALLTASDAKHISHLLLVLPKTKDLAVLPGLPFAEVLNAALKRRQKKIDELAKSPLAADLPNGALAVWMMLDPSESRFEQQTAVRKGLQLLGETEGDRDRGIR
jgi:leucyl aminopeptidase